jgi:hypothetical protein
MAGAAGHLLAALQEPDAHWYQATKYWILQLAAGLVADDNVAAALLSTVDRYYQSVELEEPAWVLADLDELRRRVGPVADVGALDPDEAVAAAREVLERLRER